MGNWKSEMGAEMLSRRPISHFPFSISAVVFHDGFIRILASYFARLFSTLSTVVHTAFQRFFSISSRCRFMHLAQSPHSSTCAINMNDNNLRRGSLLRPETAGSTLRTPRPNRYANGPLRDHRRSRFSTCISAPAIAQLEFWNPRRAHPCAWIRYTSDGKASGRSRMSGTTRAACAATAASSGFTTRTTTP